MKIYLSIIFWFINLNYSLDAKIYKLLDNIIKILDNLDNN